MTLAVALFGLFMVALGLEMTIGVRMGELLEEFLLLQVLAGSLGDNLLCQDIQWLLRTVVAGERGTGIGDRIRSFIDSRMQYVPRYRQRLAWVPLERHPVCGSGNAQRTGTDPHRRNTEHELRARSAQMARHHGGLRKWRPRLSRNDAD